MCDNKENGEYQYCTREIASSPPSLSPPGHPFSSSYLLFVLAASNGKLGGGLQRTRLLVRIWTVSWTRLHSTWLRMIFKGICYNKWWKFEGQSKARFVQYRNSCIRTYQSTGVWPQTETAWRLSSGRNTGPSPPTVGASCVLRGTVEPTWLSVSWEAGKRKMVFTHNTTYKNCI